MSESTDRSRLISLVDAYKHYHDTAEEPVNERHFHHISQLLGVRKESKHSKRRHYFMCRKAVQCGANKRPFDTTGNSILAKSTKTSDRSVPTDIIIFNCRGLITEQQNKCTFIKDICTIPDRNFVACLTETWLQKDIHCDSETENYFNEHYINRSDRDISLATEGEDGEKTKQGVVWL